MKVGGAQRMVGSTHRAKYNKNLGTISSWAAVTTLLALLFPRLLLGMFSFSTAVSSRIFPSNWNSKLVPVETLGGVAGTRVRNKCGFS